jgi:hypothetical protein
MDKINKNQEIQITVVAKDIYGGFPTLNVLAGEIYNFQVMENQTWIDSWYKTTPKGFWNFLLIFAKSRVPKAKCFCLCGTINKDESNHFEIGEKLENYTVPIDGFLYFFPNDSINHYENNKGEINLFVKRIF